MPPLYSAVKINGKRAYDLARNAKKWRSTSQLLQRGKSISDPFVGCLKCRPMLDFLWLAAKELTSAH